jgi:DNA-binding beta-propeller fold protein YncE
MVGRDGTRASPPLSLGVVDLAAGRTMRTIEGLSEPQGVLYEAASDAVYVANAGDGSVRGWRSSTR